jgi:hypothetical protein
VVSAAIKRISIGTRVVKNAVSAKSMDQLIKRPESTLIQTINTQGVADRRDVRIAS